MSSQSEEPGPVTSGDVTQTPTKEIEDYLNRIDSIVAHQGLSHIKHALAQVTDLERNHNSLVEKTQRLQIAHEQEIKDREQKDAELRRKSLKDYRESLEGLNEEKSRLSKENESLKIQIEQRLKDTRVAEQQYKTQLGEVDALRKEMKECEQRANSANRELQEVQKRLGEEQQSVKKLESTLRQRDLTDSRLRKEADAARNETQDSQKRIDKLQKQLDKIKKFVVPLADDALTDLTKELDEVWRTSLKLVRSAVVGNLPESTLKNKGIWQTVEKVAQGLPIPHSDSPTAKSMRVVLILSVLTQAFARHIFTTTYLLSEAGELDKVLDVLAERDSSHELFTRSVLLRLFANEEAQRTHSRITGMVDEVLSHIQDIIPPDKLDSFKSGLKAVAEKSAQTWFKFQRNKAHFKVTCEVEHVAEWESRTLKLPVDSDNALEGPTPCSADNIALTVFPQLVSVDEVEDKLISPGIVVVKSQLREAEEEVRAETASRAAATAYSPTRSRPRTRDGSHAQVEILGATPNGFLGGR